MRTFTDREIIEKVEGLFTFEGWKDGFYDIWIRSIADAYDRFDDKAFTYQVENGVPKFLMVRIGTSNAGSFGLLHFNTYNSKGCAVLKSNEIVYGSHAYGLHKGKKPAYVQVKPFPYFRDNNKNQKSEEIGVEYSDIIGANIHRAGAFSQIIYNWSVACLVTQQESAFLKWLNILVNAGKPRLNVAILKEW